MSPWAWLNVGSLILGLLAWGLPIFGVIMGSKKQKGRWAFVAVFSFAACAVALLFQIIYSAYLVVIEDWSAIMDTYWSVAFVSGVLVVGTVVVNLVVAVSK